MKNPLDRGERQRNKRIKYLEQEKASLKDQRSLIDSKLGYVCLELNNLYANPQLGRIVSRHLHVVPDLVEIEPVIELQLKEGEE